ncbi:MAG: ribose-phosphate diphosphokinase [Nanoarchaeota archaeon]|nr:ribose-phosphate diphosphokinase [Nanoarchaeota archaeon]
MKLFALTGTTTFAKRVAASLHQELSFLDVRSFADKELKVTVGETVRNESVYLIGQLANEQQDVNTGLMELVLVSDAMRRAGAAKIVAVLPYLPYSRQDKKISREPIGAKVVADILRASGVDQVVTMDIHAEQIAGFYDHLDNLKARSLFVNELKGHPFDVVVSPDAGGVKRVERYAKELGVDMAFMHKHRNYEQTNVVEQVQLVGDVKGAHCLLIDDMIDTGGTIIKAIEELHQKGAKQVDILCTHALLNGSAPDSLKQLQQSGRLGTIYHADTIQKDEPLKNAFVISTAPLFAQAIKAIDEGKSLNKFVQ